MRLIVVILVLLLWAGESRADRFDVAVAHIPPYAMKRDTGPEGILVDITNEAFGRLGHHVNYQFLPWPRAIQYMKTGKVDAIVPFFKSPERFEYADFVAEGLLEMDLHFFKRAGSPLNVSSLEDAMGHRIARVAKVSLGEGFQDYEDKEFLEIDYVFNSVSGLKVLVNNRVDLFASVKLIAEFAAAHNGLNDQMEIAGDAFDRLAAHIAFSKLSKKHKVAQEVAAEIEKMRALGRIDTIIRRYVPTCLGLDIKTKAPCPMARCYCGE